MALEIFNVSRDLVIQSSVAIGKISYEEALDKLVPLIDRFGQQRKLQRPKFYERLEADIIKGCIMPPITVAFVDADGSRLNAPAEVIDYVNDSISEGYILDGMQRLNTLMRAKENPRFDRSRPLFLNVIVSSRYDLLLYRMITLNNGQKPMTVRHQIEMLTFPLINDQIRQGRLENITILTEKETESSSPRGSFRAADIVSAYTAYFTDTEHNQNTRVIEEKLDEILVGRIMESDLSGDIPSFSEVLSQIDRLCVEARAKDWFRNENNLIGFTVGVKRSFRFLCEIPPDRFADELSKFESAFAIINPSKVNVGRYRRELSRRFIERIQIYASGDVSDMEEDFLDHTAM